MAAIAVIPARYASTRFPGKPLARETGKFLIQHVVERVRLTQGLDRVLVATDDERIAAAVASFGGESVMTDPAHASGTDRIAEVARRIGGAADDILLNVQGDEPEIEPEVLSRLIRRMRDAADCPSGTLACPFPPEANPADPNRVKVVVDARGRAIYFSRAQIPYPRDGASAGHLLHLGVYAYRRAFLLEFAAWPPGRLEQIEKLEQLRVLENGAGMLVEVVARGAPGVDTPEDYAAFVRRTGSSRG